MTRAGHQVLPDSTQILVEPCGLPQALHLLLHLLLLIQKELGSIHLICKSLLGVSCLTHPSLATLITYSLH